MSEWLEALSSVLESGAEAWQSGQMSDSSPAAPASHEETAREAGRVAQHTRSVGRSSLSDQDLRAIPPQAPDPLQEAHRLHEQHQYEEALQQCGAALALDPTSAGAYALRGEVLIKMGRPRGAVLDLRAALQLDPHLESARQLLAGLTDKPA